MNLLSVREMRQRIAAHHYTHSLPSGESIFTQYEDAIIVFSRPSNKNVSRWLLGADDLVWELSRMWAPDGHRRNLLTQAIADCVPQFMRLAGRVSAGECRALVSYADPNAGHEGAVYRAASWAYLGQSEESRFYVDGTGQSVARRAFHSGGRHLRKSEIVAQGFSELSKPGKHRFAKGLTRGARARIARLAAGHKTENDKPLCDNDN